MTWMSEMHEEIEMLKRRIEELEGKYEGMQEELEEIEPSVTITRIDGETKMHPWEAVIADVSATWGGHPVTYDTVVASVLSDLANLKRRDIAVEGQRVLLAQIVDACGRTLDHGNAIASGYAKRSTPEEIVALGVMYTEGEGWSLDLDEVQQRAYHWLISTYEEGQS